MMIIKGDRGERAQVRKPEKRLNPVAVHCQTSPITRLVRSMISGWTGATEVLLLNFESMRNTCCPRPIRVLYNGVHRRRKTGI